MKTPRARISSLAPLVALLGTLVLLQLLAGDAAAAWSSPITVSSSGSVRQSALVSDPRTGYAHLVWHDEVSGNWYAECHPNGGCSQPAPLGAQISRPILGATHEDLLRPAIAIDKQGNLFAGFTSNTSGALLAYLQRKGAGAAAWGPPVLVGTGSQVRLAVDPNAQVHVVWGSGGMLSYRRYDSSGSAVVTQMGIVGQNPALAADDLGNAHLVLERPDPTTSTLSSVVYQEILADGTLGSAQTISPPSEDASAPTLALDTTNHLHFVWTAKQAIDNVRYMRCDAGTLANCTAPITLNTDGIPGMAASITTIGENFFVSYMQKPTSDTSFPMLYDGSRTIYPLRRVDSQPNAYWPAISSDPRAARLDLIYRYSYLQQGFSLLYRYQFLAKSAGTPSPAASTTPSRTVTPTPTIRPRARPVNLSQSAAFDRAPGIAIAGSGERVVVWEQDIGTTSTILARVASPDGMFGAAQQLSTDPHSVRPGIFAAPTGVHVILQEGNHLAYTALNGGAWSALTRIQPSGGTVEYPQGVRAADGTIWFAWTGLAGGRRDIWAMPLNGPAVQLSTSGYASKPTLAAGENSLVYVAWVERAPGSAHGPVRISMWNGAAWVSLPSPAPAGGQVALAFGAGRLVTAWTGGTRIRWRVWDGSAWSPAREVNGGIAPAGPRVAVATDGTVQLAWTDGGRIYLSTNGSTPRVISGGIANAGAPSLNLDSQDIPHVVFANGEVWYIANP